MFRLNRVFLKDWANKTLIQIYWITGIIMLKNTLINKKQKKEKKKNMNIDNAWWPEHIEKAYDFLRDICSQGIYSDGICDLKKNNEIWIQQKLREEIKNQNGNLIEQFIKNQIKFFTKFQNQESIDELRRFLNILIQFAEKLLHKLNHIFEKSLKDINEAHSTHSDKKYNIEKDTQKEIKSVIEKLIESIPIQDTSNSDNLNQFAKKLLHELKPIFEKSQKSIKEANSTQKHKIANIEKGTKKVIKCEIEGLIESIPIQDTSNYNIIDLLKAGI